MGIRTTFSGNAQAIDLSSIADEMLAQVIADHAAERFRVANRANRQVAGSDIAYSVAVNGRVVSRGRGDLFPTNQVSVVVRRTPGRRHSIVVDWLWHQMQPATLRRVIEAYGQIGNAAALARVLMNPREELFRFALMTYLRYRYPAVMARLARIDDAISAAKALYRFYRVARIAGGVVGGGGQGSADADVLSWIARKLHDRSPFVSGDYRAAHALYGDGRLIMGADEVSADGDLPEAKEYSFTNTVPYSRKIEFGKTQAGRDFVIQVPNRIYERVAADARAQFQGVADISFEMRAVTDGVQTPQGAARRQHNKPDVRYPSIVVRF